MLMGRAAVACPTALSGSDVWVLAGVEILGMTFSNFLLFFETDLGNLSVIASVL